MSALFDLDTIRKVLTEVPVHLYEGTCELCRNKLRRLSDVGGVYCCDLCRNTIARRIKETNKPFDSVTAHMDPKLMGPGVPGEKRPLPPTTTPSGSTSTPSGGSAHATSVTEAAYQVNEAIKKLYEKQLLALARGERPLPSRG